MMCKIVKVSTELSITGDERWILLHECGKIERRLRRKRGSRQEKPAPKTVKCDKKKQL